MAPLTRSLAVNRISCAVPSALLGTGCHPSPQVILPYLVVEPLAGEFEGIVIDRRGCLALAGESFAKRAVRIGVLDGTRAVEHEPDAAEAVVDVEILSGCLVAVALAEDLPAVGVDI